MEEETVMNVRVVCVPVDPEGAVEARWGRAPRVAVARVGENGTEESWDVHEVGWDVLHDARTEGLHHANVARFLQDQAVTDVVADHMGPGMEHMLARMGLRVHLGAAGDARAAVRAALG
jgi:predicted Fe-Mo cluster-binding NifX family protein